MDNPTAGHLETQSALFGAGVILLDLAGRILLINDAAAHMLAVSQRDVFNCTVGELAGICDSDTSSWSMLIDEILSDPAQFADDSHYAQLTNVYRVISVEVSIVRDAEGFIGLASVLRDVTREALLAKERHTIIAALVHDMKSPLGIAVTALETYIQDVLGGRTVEEALEAHRGSGYIDELSPFRHLMLSYLESSLGSLRRIVDIGFEYMIVEFDGADLNFQSLDMRTLIDDAIKSFGQFHNEGQGTFQVEKEIAEDIKSLKGEPHRLRYALGALVANAYKNSPKSEKIMLRATSERKGVLIQVSDAGPSIPDQDRGRVFEIGFTRPFTHRPRFYSRYLRLSKAREIVRQHNGRITVESTPDHGTTFTVWLPYEQ